MKLMNLKAQVLNRYDLKYSNRKFAKATEKVITETNVDDCALACDKELGFECQSFDYCFTNGDCHLSKATLGNDMSEYTQAECDIYESKWPPDSIICLSLIHSKIIVW